MLGVGVFTVVLILGFFGVKTFILDSGKNEDELLGNALILGDIVIGLYREEVTPSSLDVVRDKEKYYEDVVSEVQEHQSYLNSLDEAVFNLSEYHYTNYEAYLEDETHFDVFLRENPGEGLFTEVVEEGFVPAENKPMFEDYVFLESSFIYYEGDVAFIKVKDIPFKKGVATISYKNSNFTILQVNLPQTYTAIKEDTRYLYTYTAYLFSKDTNDFVDLQYTSVEDKEMVKIIRVFYDKKETITGFTVR